MIKNQSLFTCLQDLKHAQLRSWFRLPVSLTVRSTLRLEEKSQCKSIMGMMTLGLDAGEEITLSANGEDEEDAMKSIENYLSNQ